MDDDLPKIGFGLPVSGAWATPASMRHVARRAEELGYSALWTFQRVLSPVLGGSERHDAAAGAPERAADDPSYLLVHDPVVPLAYVAGHTERIGLGTATMCAPFIPPAVLAKTMVTLDHVTQGRLSVGLGIGWMAQEYAAAGVPFERRGARMEEYLRCLAALWTDDPVEFDGEFYTVPRSHAGLAPVQRPHPPLLIGGAAPAALRRAGRLAEGWIGSTNPDPGQVGDQIDVVREGAREAGRDAAALRFLVRAVVELTDADPGPDRQRFKGTRQQVLDDLAALHRAGVTEVFVDLNFSPQTGSPAADPEAAAAYADEVLDALAPSSAG